MRQVIDLLGTSWGNLSVIEMKGSNGNKSIEWLCLCSCGRKIVVDGRRLRNGNTRSCGCLVGKGNHHKTHGKTGTRVYNTWRGMLDRCNSPSHILFPKYGKKGITVCERWLSFENFLADMGEPGEGLSIERKDGNKGYSPDNCIWADLKTQNCNRKGVRMFTHQGVTDSLNGWCTRTGIPFTTFTRRLAKGVSFEVIVDGTQYI